MGPIPFFFPRSLRWRLQLWLGFLLGVVLIGFGTTAWQLHRGHRLAQIDLELEARVAEVSDDYRRGGRPHPPDVRELTGDRPRPHVGGNPERPETNALWHEWLHLLRNHSGHDFNPGRHDVTLSPSTLARLDANDPAGWYFIVWARDGNRLIASTNCPAKLPRPRRTGGDTSPHLRNRGLDREAYHFTELGDCVLVGRSMALEEAGIRKFAIGLGLAGVAVLCFGLGGGWWLTTQALQPLERIRAAATRMAAGRLSERIDDRGAGSELRDLVTVLNNTFSRLESAFDRQRRFTSDAAHELRTPIAVLISEAQTTLTRDRSAAEYRETVNVCLETAQQMRQLTQALLNLAQLENEVDQRRMEPFDLAALAQSTVERLRSLVSSEGLSLEMDLAPTDVVGNPIQLGQVVSNLVINAIHYNRPGGSIHVRTKIDSDSAIVVVEDTGQGIAPEDMPHLFERFYRGDKSRSRADGRYGLGLAISQAIVEAHHGTITVVSELGRGSTFTIRLPPAPVTGNSHPVG